MTKNIEIHGTHNKYLFKKLIKTDNSDKENKKVERKKLLPDLYYETSEQESILYNEDDEIRDLLIKNIKSKLSSYKQQDIVKNRYQENAFVSLDYVIHLLKEMYCRCAYCKNVMMLFYYKSHDKAQWTLDRINNDIGHNTGNVVVSCLLCNTQKRKRDHEKFSFTKSLKIEKES